MKTFDQVASIENTDPNSFAISNALSKEAAAKTAGTPPEINDSSFKAGEFSEQLENAYGTNINNSE